MTYANAASVGGKWPGLQLRTLDVDGVAVSETWLQLQEGDDKLLAQG